VRALVEETARCRSIELGLADWPGHAAGQHVDVRLTAADGYQAQRSYSIASAPQDANLVLTVERLADGEVSPYLCDELRVGDQLELRGPIGGYFVWPPAEPAPTLLVAGGSGVVPFRAMLRARATLGGSPPMRLLYSSRSWAETIYREELARLDEEEGVEVHFTLTRSWPDGWTGHRGRIDRALLDAVSWSAGEEPAIYICGSDPFVESAAQALVASGHDAGRIRTERFGASG
jgi:ferredoxin-NADP reductase